MRLARLTVLATLAVLAAPLASEAELAVNVHRIGFLGAASALGASQLAALGQGLS